MVFGSVFFVVIRTRPGHDGTRCPEPAGTAAGITQSGAAF